MKYFLSQFIVTRFEKTQKTTVEATLRSQNGVRIWRFGDLQLEQITSQSTRIKHQLSLLNVPTSCQE